MVESGLSTLAQDYAKVLAEYVVGSMMEQDTVPGWVQYTAQNSRVLFGKKRLKMNNPLLLLHSYYTKGPRC